MATSLFSQHVAPFKKEKSMAQRNDRKLAKIMLALVLALLLATGCDTVCLNSDAVKLPPKNKYLSDSPWPVNHGDSYYQQNSREYSGPAKAPSGEPDFLLGRPGMLNSYFSDTYPDGSYVIWGSGVGEVYKIDPMDKALRFIDRIKTYDFKWMPDKMAEKLSFMPCRQLADIIIPMVPEEETTREGEGGTGTSGHYCFLGSDGLFYQILYKKIRAYGDKVGGDRLSPIEVKREWEIPKDRFIKDYDKLIAAQVTYDGMIAFVTNYGLVGVVDRLFEKAYFLQLGHGEEYVFNGFCVDEDGGLYIATHKAMYRVQWTGEKLSADENDGGWRAEYGTGKPNSLSMQSLAGTGSSPSLMGIGEGEDKFVVITDGEELMNILLFWRDKIPEDWKQLSGTKSRRVAGKVPVTFGDPNRKRSFSDQSVLVYGYGAFVVNNEMQKQYKKKIEQLIYGGLPEIAPHGCEKFEWYPDTRSLRSVWANSEVSFPNAIPTMSPATNLIYQIGQRDGVWTIEALDWDTGEVKWTRFVGEESRYNSAFSPVIIGPDQTIYYGTEWGTLRISP